MAIELPPNLPIGVRFHPTDEELITHYLRPKILGKHFDDAIAEINFCNYEPWELPEKSKIKSEDRNWWFICPHEFKSQRSKQIKRKTNKGFWKITGRERTIKDHNNVCIGKKRTLVFELKDRTSVKKTNWVMHEYFLNPLPQGSGSYFICRLKRKTDENIDRGEPSGCTISDFENYRQTHPFQQLHDQMEANYEPRLSRNLILTEDDCNYLLSDEYKAKLNRASEGDPFEFVDNILIDHRHGIYLNEVGNNLLRESSQSAQMQRYFTDALDASDTDAEGVSTQYVDNLDISNPFDSPSSSKRVRHKRMVKNLSEPLRFTAESDCFGEERAVSVSNPICTIEQSLSSTMNRPDLAISLLNSKPIKPQSESPKYVDVRGGGRQKRIQIQKHSRSTETSSNKGKEVITTAYRLRKDGLIIREYRNAVEGSNVEKMHLKSASGASKWKNFFTFMETSPVSECESLPRLVCWFNAISGTVLFGIFARELVVFGNW